MYVINQLLLIEGTQDGFQYLSQESSYVYLTLSTNSTLPSFWVGGGSVYLTRYPLSPLFGGMIVHPPQKEDNKGQR